MDLFFSLILFKTIIPSNPIFIYHMLNQQFQYSHDQLHLYTPNNNY